MHPIIAQIEKEIIASKPKLADFKVGDTIRVHYKIREKIKEEGKEREKERIQTCEGVVIRRRGSGLSETFTIRKVSFGVGVEWTFFLHSPTLEKITVIRRGKVRRARLYYLRTRLGKKAKVTEAENKKPISESEKTKAEG